jgi:hypothetical protein
MVNETIVFPIYRKYEGGRSFFRISSPQNFEEIQVMGNKLYKYSIEATILPDFHLINDMINKENNHWVESSKNEFEVFEQKYNQTIKT